MKRRGKMLDNLERLLISAYRGGEEVHPSAGWNAAVMSEIRLLGALEEEKNGQALFGRFAWRFSLAAGFVALILLAYVFSNGFVDYQELAIRFLENPIDFII